MVPLAPTSQVCPSPEPQTPWSVTCAPVFTLPQAAPAAPWCKTTPVLPLSPTTQALLPSVQAPSRFMYVVLVAAAILLDAQLVPTRKEAMVPAEPTLLLEGPAARTVTGWPAGL